jgi:hypothetical protein
MNGLIMDAPQEKKLVLPRYGAAGYYMILIEDRPKHRPTLRCA